MALIKSPLLRGARGRMADVTFLQRNGDTIMRQARTSNTNPRTDAQMSRRVRLSNLVNMYRCGAQWMPKAFQGKRPAWSDFNAFVSANLNNSPVALSKDEAAQGGCVVAPYLVTKGNLMSVACNKRDNRWITNISLGQLELNDGSLINIVSRFIVENNSWLNYGDQISFVSYQQITNPETGIPMVVCNSYELTLSRTDTRYLWDFLPQFCCSSVSKDGRFYVGTNSNVSTGGFTYIISRRTRRGVEVSTQRLVMSDTSVLNAYSTAEQIAKAMDSYGRTSDVFLDPASYGEADSEAKDPGGLVSLLGVRGNVDDPADIPDLTPTNMANTDAVKLSQLLNGYQYLGLYFSNEVDLSDIRIWLQPQSGNIVTSSIMPELEQSTGRTKVAVVPNSIQRDYGDYQVVNIVAKGMDNINYTCPFKFVVTDLS